MMHGHISATLAMIALLIGIGIAGASPMAGGGGDYAISWYTVDGGGGSSSAGDFQLIGTIAQADATPMPATGSGFQVVGGFWAASGGAAPTCDGDGTGDGLVNVEDLVSVILAWGTSDPAADLNNDGIVNVEDMIMVVVNWGACP